MFSINWNEKAKNDPVVNYFFEKYVYGGEYIQSNTTDIKIKSKDPESPKKVNIDDKILTDDPRKEKQPPKPKEEKVSLKEKKDNLPKISKEENKKL